MLSSCLALSDQEIHITQGLEVLSLAHLAQDFQLTLGGLVVLPTVPGAVVGLHPYCLHLLDQVLEVQTPGAVSSSHLPGKCYQVRASVWQTPLSHPL